MFTFVPLPNWPDFFYSSISVINQENATQKPWNARNLQAAWFSRGTHALDHIIYAWSKTHNEIPPVIWLPDYFCNSATVLMRKRGASLIFYPIGADLSPDWNACQFLIDNAPAPNIFLLTHYFGHAASAPQILRFCQNVGALILEDAAHVLYPHGNIGTMGDATLFCPHKVLAAPDGALLSGMFADQPDGKRFEASSSVWLLKRFTQKILPNTVLKRLIHREPDFWADDNNKMAIDGPAPSRLGQAMICRHAAHIEALADARKQVAELWRYAFISYSDHCAAFFEPEKEGPVPYRFVLSCRGPKFTASCFDAFRAEGVAVESWPDLAPEVIENKKQHPQATHFRKTLLFFPVFGALTPDFESLVKRCIETALRTTVG